MIGNIITNNISFGNTTRELSATLGGENSDTTGSGNIYTYNNFGEAAANFIEWQAGTYISTYAIFDDSVGGATNSVAGDPLFTDAANNDFTLDDSSPAIDAGTDVSLVLDYAGNTVPFNVLPDIGAYEYSVSAGYQKRYKRFSDFWRYKRY